MKYAIIALLYLFATSCNTNSQTPLSTTSKDNNNEVQPTIDSSIIDTASLGLNFIPQGSYNSIKARIKRDRVTSHSSEDFENYLLNQIIPFWYGTEWDFNGYTAIPNQGVIACGYFVSTTLQHVGINIDRYKLAQQAGLNEAKSLALGEGNYFITYGIDSLQSIMVRDYEDGLYFVGLDNHVGFLYMKNKDLYFLHSNYIEDKVMIEKALFSPAFQSNIYVVAELSTNDAFLEKWRKGGRFEVVRS